jgi:hypothetical protein
VRTPVEDALMRAAVVLAAILVVCGLAIGGCIP